MPMGYGPTATADPAAKSQPVTLPGKIGRLDPATGLDEAQPVTPTKEIRWLDGTPAPLVVPPVTATGKFRRFI
jgi:hypothetical protein